MFHHKTILISICIWTFFRGADSTVMSFQYKSQPCSDASVLSILRSPVLEENQTKSLFHCATACSKTGLDGGCQYAIYRRTSLMCNLIEKMEITNDVPGYVHEDGCRVIHAPRECHNGGSQLGPTCKCPIEYVGNYCNIHNPIYCHTRGWRLATEQDYQMLATSQIPIKMKFGSEIVPVKSFHAHGETETNYTAQANGFFATDENSSTDLLDPLQTLFVLHNVLNGSSLLARMNRNGTVAVSKMSSSVHLLFPSVLDDNRLVFSQNKGTPNDVIASLSVGHSLLQRDSKIRVEFHQDTGSASFSSAQSCVELNNNTGNDWTRPLSYRSFKESLKTKTRYVVNHQVNNPLMASSHYEKLITPHWEVDRCWTRINPAGGDLQFLSVLKEHVKRGAEIKIVINKNIMSDVLEVRCLKKDIVAQLAPYITPIDPDGTINSDSKINFPVVSFSHMISVCQMNLQTSEAVRKQTTTISGSVEWYVSTRPWRKVYRADRNGIVVYGNKSDIVQAALEGKSFRVCFYSRDVYCQGSQYIKVTSRNEVVLQTLPVFAIQKSSSGLFLRINYNKCPRYQRLVSTEGKVVKIKMDLMEENPFSSPTSEFELFMEG